LQPCAVHQPRPSSFTAPCEAVSLAAEDIDCPAVALGSCSDRRQQTERACVKVLVRYEEFVRDALVNSVCLIPPAGPQVDIVRGYDWPRPFTIRTLKNIFVERWLGSEDELKAQSGNELPRFQRAWESGDAEYGAVVVGESIGMIHEIEPVELVMSKIVKRAEKAINIIAADIRSVGPATLRGTILFLKQRGGDPPG
jgi:hypothetical protein